MVKGTSFRVFDAIQYPLVDFFTLHYSEQRISYCSDYTGVFFVMLNELI